jgi:2-polyprenyl-6-methoxyphenol hydroxylase-like FAD-dependent oxidoreductase
MVDVLVVGAGPTGLTAACEASRHGLSVRIVERRARRARHSKALVVHARTMEVLELMGCAAPTLEAGQRFRALHVHTRPGRHRAYVDLLDRRWGDTRYPFWLSIPQYETERVLESHLEAMGEPLEWSTELVALEERDEFVSAMLRTPSGALVEQRARWVLGCDGGRSLTRRESGMTMERDEMGVSFALADVHTESDLAADEGHVVLSNDGLLLIVPMTEPGVWRLIAHVPDGMDSLDAAGWQALVEHRSGFDLGIRRMGWSSHFQLSSGVADRFRNGRVFLLGDAAHVHSPVGGQGLNTGVQDAHNLIWKLALVQRPEVDAETRRVLLDSYESERRAIAADMVRNTGRATRALTLRNPLARGALRSFARIALRSRRFKDRLGRGVGMLELLTGGAPRLPNPEVEPGVRLHDRVDPRLPTLLNWKGRQLLVRPDRIVANVGSLPHYVETTVASAEDVS